MRSSADVVIAGGGCMGCSLAWHLAQRGITNVVLLEREPQLGAGSTGKNAGGFRHQFSNSANIELSIESIELMKDFEQIVGTPIDFHQDGYLFLLSKSANVETFRKNVALQKTHGVDVRWVSNDEAVELSPGLDLTGVKGATYCPSDGVADPNGVTMGFAKGAQAKGVEIVRECEVTGARLKGHRLTDVRTSKGDISTPVLVNAAARGRNPSGAFSASTSPWSPSGVTSSSRQHRAAERGTIHGTPAACRSRRSSSSISKAPSTSTAKAEDCCSAWAIPKRSLASTPRCAGISCRR
jgi:sarcosine oxidase subunit beta